MPINILPAWSRKAIFFAIMILVIVSGCQINPLALPFQPTSTETPTSTSTPRPTPTDVPSSTALPQPTKQIFKNIPYLQKAGVDPNLLSLDIYTPASEGLHPVIVMIHGGSWSGGDKDTVMVSSTKSQFFTNNGIVFVSINYRLSPAVTYPEHAEDVAAALAWVSMHIRDYGGDPGELFVMGHSAGAQLAALVATDARFLSIYNIKPSDLRGVILLDAAGLDIPGTMSPTLTPMYTNAFGTNPLTWAEASPVTYIAPDKGIPPFLVTYTFQVTPFTQSSQEFAGKLETAGVTVWEYGISLDTHDSINDNVGTLYDPVTNLIMIFMEETLPGTNFKPIIWK
ncbi:MAG: alpha/beta hydrolase [Anaerolineales bacterium]